MNKYRKHIIYLAIFLLFNSHTVFSGHYFQNGNDSVVKTCPDTAICINEAMRQFDYRSQSYTTLMTQGDSLKYVFIVYTRQDFRIMVCNESALGSISYKIVEPVREIVNKVKKVNENEEIIYKLDEYGEQILGSDDKPVILSKEMLRDTIWDKKVTVNETLLFDSEQSSGKNYYDIVSTDRTKRLMIKLKVNGSDKNISGCVSILIGRKYTNPFKLSSKE